MASMHRMRLWLEYAALWLVLKTAGLLPRRAARAYGHAVAAATFRLWPQASRAA
jgi:hypothetical protein